MWLLSTNIVVFSIYNWENTLLHLSVGRIGVERELYLWSRYTWRCVSKFSTNTKKYHFIAHSLWIHTTIKVDYFSMFGNCTYIHIYKLYFSRDLILFYLINNKADPFLGNYTLKVLEHVFLFNLGHFFVCRKCFNFYLFKSVQFCFVIFPYHLFEILNSEPISRDLANFHFHCFCFSKSYCLKLYL